MYLALARQTDRHGAFSQADVDGMDIEVVAALLGVGEAPDMLGQAQDMTRRRMEAARNGAGPVRWADLQPSPN